MTARHGLPIPVQTFAGYGLWFARNAVPEVDERLLTRVAPVPGGFEAVTEEDRVEPTVEVLLGQEVLTARAVPGGGVRLETADRSLETEHVIAATGFRATRDRLRPGDAVRAGGGVYGGGVGTGGAATARAEVLSRTTADIRSARTAGSRAAGAARVGADGAP